MAEKYISTAKVIDGTLILSLPDAVTPVVWQMELGQSKSSALEIRNTGNDNFTLTLKTPRQDVLEIATYNNRDQAIKALLVVSQAMEKAHGQLKSAPQPNSYPVPVISSGNFGYQGYSSSLKRFSLFIVKIVGFTILAALVLVVLGKLFLTGTKPTNLTAGNAPVSADDFLESR